MMAAITVAAVLIPARPVLAAVTSSVDNGVLTVTGDDEIDSVKIKCSSGDEVRINGDSPDTGIFACSALTGIVVSTLGASDRVSLEKVDATKFPAVTSILLLGGEGDDVLVGSDLDDSIDGEAGNDDILPAGGEANVVDGGVGRDEIIEERVGSAVVTGTTFTADGASTISRIEGVILQGTNHGDSIDASKFDGRADLNGNAGADELLAGGGPSFLYGGDGADKLSGGAATDEIFGGKGPDELLGKRGADRLDGGEGTDVCKGGPGSDQTRNCE